MKTVAGSNHYHLSSFLWGCSLSIMLGLVRTNCKWSRLTVPVSLWVCCGCLLACASTALAAPEDPKVKAAIKGGIRYLRGAGSYGSGYDSLVAYALLKAGESEDSVRSTIDKVRGKISSGSYRPRSHHRYEAGCDLMMLEAADAKKYFVEIEAIAKYLIAAQHTDGHWSYTLSDFGDTSISQYALLGLWAARRAGVEVPLSVWEDSARWHMRTQAKNGGFTYHPAEGNRNEGSATHTMAVAGTGSLYVARLHLFPKAGPLKVRSAAPKTAKGSKKKITFDERYSFLIKIDLDRVEAEDDGAGQPDSTDKPFKRTLRQGSLDERILAGLAWNRAFYNIKSPTGSGKQLYYLYGLERVSVLASIEEYNGRDWYADGADSLIATQNRDGSWDAASNSSAATAFALLFLSRATEKLINRPSRNRHRIRSGLLGGGRGLPQGLENVEMKNGRITSKTTTAPLEAMLAQLEQTSPANVLEAQEAIVETIQIGNPEELVGQIARLRKLASDPRAEVRRVAIWAIGRTRDVQFGTLLIAALKDADVGVMTEAHNALCVLARKPLGLGVPDRPDAGLPEDADAEARQRAAEKWSRQATRAWSEWYKRIRPYDERDDLPPPDEPA